MPVCCAPNNEVRVETEVSPWKGLRELKGELLFQFVTADVAVDSHLNEAHVKGTLH